FNLLGIADAAYLTIAHYSQSVVLACPTTTFINCAKVTSSSYSEIHGVPVSIFGLLFFIVMFNLQLPIFWTKRFAWIKWYRLAFAGLGMISVFWFVYVELYKLNAICLYCTGVHILTFFILVLTLIGTEILQVVGKTKS
ncbi:MAG TPA: vitamin K epoxide reductase family protein, partial [Candidatus Saccharimonadia bacterium]|nr:vitamin K epoxide reductase family protein [Candidatus Saccharimonadia bacterium]